MNALVGMERRNGIATLTLNRPDRLNALDLPLAEAFGHALAEVARDDQVRCVMLRGAGKGFMAGGDVASFHAHMAAMPRPVEKLIGTYHKAVRTLATMPKPTVAVLHGAVAGAGMSLALTTDLAIAAEGTVFTLAYSALGTSPDGGSTWLLPRLVGRRRAMELALLPDRFDATRAAELGLVNKVVPAAELDQAADALATRLAEGPTKAYVATKRLIDQSFGNDLSGQLDAELASFAGCSTTEDFREGVTAFVEKRKPNFKGL